MTKLIKASGPSRRGIVKAAGVVGPALLCRHCCACARLTLIIRTDRSSSWSPIRRAALPTLSAACYRGALTESTGKTFIVDNRGGAGGNIGMEYVAHAEPDGYTDLLATNAYSVNYWALQSVFLRSLTRISARVSELRHRRTRFVVKSELAGEVHEGFYRARPRQSRKIQLCDSADRHDGATTIGSRSRSAQICRTGRRRI